jgi:adenylate cyclase
MRYTLSQKVGHIARVILAWFAAFLLFALTRFYGTINADAAAEKLWSSSAYVYVSQIFMAAVITGLLYGMVDLFVDKPKYQRWSFWKLLLLKGTLHFFIILITLTALMIGRVRFGIVEFNELEISFGYILSNKSFQVFVVFFTLTSWLMNAYQQVNQKFGRGVLIEMLMGKYHKPQEADRILMFIDLRSSVHIAEVLGHIKYSSLLQDCYFDLNTQLAQYKAKIYQYVGDQVVLHWSLEDGLQNSNSIRCFFAFINRLKERDEYYQETYGLKPYFKAGAHMGRVTVAEVGLLKRSIAFHGDTVNTTSRIHDQCNAHKQQLLVSRDLLSRLIDKSELKYVFVGDEILKGKHHSMELYGIQDVAVETSDG